jgi:hypothetical protein
MAKIDTRTINEFDNTAALKGKRDKLKTKSHKSKKKVRDIYS